MCISLVLTVTQMQYESLGKRNRPLRPVEAKCRTYFGLPI